MEFPAISKLAELQIRFENCKPKHSSQKNKSSYLCVPLPVLQIGQVSITVFLPYLASILMPYLNSALTAVPISKLQVKLIFSKWTKLWFSKKFFIKYGGSVKLRDKYPPKDIQVTLLGWAWPEPGRCSSPEASKFTSKVSQNGVLNVRNNFQPSLSTIIKHVFLKS